MPVSDPDVSRPRLIRDAIFLEADRREIALRRGPHNRLGFAYQVAFVRVLGRFPQQAPLEIDGEILRFAALQTGGRYRDDSRLRPPAADGLRASAAYQRVPATAHFRCRRGGERLARFLEDDGAADRPHRLAAGAGARLAPRRARSRPGRLGAAPRDRGCLAQGPGAVDATHGRAPVGTDGRPFLMRWSRSTTTSRTRPCTASRPTHRTRRSVA